MPGGRLAGAWDWAPEAGEVVLRLFAGLRADAATAVEEEANREAGFLSDEICDSPLSEGPGDNAEASPPSR